MATRTTSPRTASRSGSGRRQRCVEKAAHPRYLGPAPLAGRGCGDRCWHCYRRRKAGLAPEPPKVIARSTPGMDVMTRPDADSIARLDEFAQRFDPPLSRYRLATMILQAWRPGDLGIRAPRK